MKAEEKAEKIVEYFYIPSSKYKIINKIKRCLWKRIFIKGIKRAQKYNIKYPESIDK